MLERINNRLYELVYLEPANPAAGLGYQSPAGDNSRRLLTTIQFKFTSAVAAANRLVQIIHLNPTAAFRMPIGQPPQVQAASLIFNYNFGIGQQLTNNSAGAAFDRHLQSALNSHAWLNPADMWQIYIENEQAADQLADISYFYWREINPAT